MDVNIYDDINDFDLGEEIEKLKTENRMLDEHIHSLQADIEKLTSTIMKLKENQDNLTKNISSLYLTAKAEIDRKDRMINDLRTQLDSMYFRRHNVNVEPKRKEIEDNTSDINVVNVAKRFKHDFDDRSYDRSKSQSKYSCDRSNDRYSNRSRSGSKERVNKYTDDRGRRYNDRDRWNDDRDRRINDREKWDDRDKRGNGAQASEDKYFGSRYSGYDRRRPFERQHHSWRETPSLHPKDNTENRPEAKPTQEKDAIDKMEEKVTSKETEKVSTFVGARSASHTSVSENEDMPRNKPTKKRLKMLDVMEEKIRKKRSTPVKVTGNTFEQNKNVKKPLRILMDELDNDYLVVSDTSTEESKSSFDRLSITSIDKNIKSGKCDQLNLKKCQSTSENLNETKNKELKCDTQSDRKNVKINNSTNFTNISKEFPDNNSGKVEIKFDHYHTKRNTDLGKDIFSKSDLKQIAESSAKHHLQTDKNSLTGGSTSVTKRIVSKTKEESLEETFQKSKEFNAKDLERKGYSKHCSEKNKSSDTEFIMMQKEKVMQSLPKNLSISQGEIIKKETELKDDLVAVTKSNQCTREEKSEPPKIAAKEEIRKTKESSKEKLEEDKLGFKSSKDEVDGCVKKETKTNATDLSSSQASNEKSCLIVKVENLESLGKENIVERNKRRSKTPAKELQKSKEPKEECEKEKTTERSKKRSKTPAKELQISKEHKEETEKEKQIDIKNQQKETSKNENRILPHTMKSRRREGNKDDIVIRIEDCDSTAKEDEKSLKKPAKETLEKEELSSKKDTKSDVKTPENCTSQQKKEKKDNKPDDSSAEEKVLKEDTRKSPRTTTKVDLHKSKEFSKEKSGKKGSSSTKSNKTDDLNTEAKDSLSVAKNLEDIRQSSTTSTRDVNMVEKNEINSETELHLKDNVDSSREHKNKNELTMKVDVCNSVIKDLDKENNRQEDKSSKNADKERAEKEGIDSKLNLLFGDEESRHKEDEDKLSMELDTCSPEVIVTAKASIPEEVKKFSKSSVKVCSKEKMERRRSTSKRDSLFERNKNKDVRKDHENDKDEVSMEVDICDSEVKDLTKISTIKSNTKISSSSDKKGIQKPKEFDKERKVVKRSSKKGIQKENNTDEPAELHLRDEVIEVKENEKNLSGHHGDTGRFEKNNETAKPVVGNKVATLSSEETVESKMMTYSDMGNILNQALICDRKSNSKTKSKEISNTANIPEENLLMTKVEVSRHKKSQSVPKKRLTKSPVKENLNNDETEGLRKTSEANKQASIHKKLDALIVNCLTSDSVATSESKETVPKNNCSSGLQTVHKHKSLSTVEKSVEQTPVTVEVISSGNGRTNTLPPNSNSGSSPIKNTQDVTPGKSTPRRRITPTPVKDDKPICSFENILEKTSQSPTFSNATPLHLTHDGEIPVLHLEDNHINNLPTETNINDKNIMNLLDSMSISNMESDMSKFKSITTETGATHDINLNLSLIEGDNFTFENVINKATSTPEVPNSKSFDKDSDVKTRFSLSDTQSSGVGGDVSNLTDKIANRSLPTLTTPIRRRRRCRLIIKD